jgi:sugar phosphate isomerase/epimerase
MKNRLIPAAFSLALASATIAFAGDNQDCKACAIDYHDHIGMQMWSLRETTKTDVPKAFDFIKDYGLTEIETAGLGNLTLDQYVAEMKARHLKAIGMHAGYEELGKDVNTVIATAKTLGAHYVVCPWIPHPKEGLTVEQAHKVAADFNTWGAAIRAAGLQFGWHPHGFEFGADASGVTPFSVIVSETSAANLALEMDVFWVYHAGQDPVKLLKQYPDRWRLMHVKDIRVGAKVGDQTGGAPDTDNVPVGQGQIDWPSVLATAQMVGVQHYIIEDETPDALHCIPQTIGYLRGLKLSCGPGECAMPMDDACCK